MDSYKSIFRQLEKFSLALQTELERNWSSLELAYCKLTSERSYEELIPYFQDTENQPKNLDEIFELKPELGNKLISQINSGEKIVSFDFNKKSLRALNQKEKFCLYIFLRYSLNQINDEFQKSQIEDIVNYLKKINSGSEIISVLSELNQNYFNNWIYDYFFEKKNRRIFFSTLIGKQKKQLSLLERLLSGQFLVKLKISVPPKPKKKVFRKGYRDHGSIGSGFSQIRREELKDVFLREAERERIKRTKDSLQFLLGFLD